MKLAIKGHPKRGNEVIETLEMLGGVNSDGAYGNLPNGWNVGYYIFNGVIEVSEVEILTKKKFKIYTLEEFLNKFPYKVGDKVQYKGATSCGSIFEVEEMRWEENTVKYTLCLFGCNYKRSTLPAEYLQPYKEETMEEKLEQIIFDIPDGYEFFGINDDNQVVLAKKQPQYPKTYEECCEILSLNTLENDVFGYKHKLIIRFQELLIARDAYWKIVGEQMGLDKPWKPDYITEDNQLAYIITTQRGYLSKNTARHWNYILAFPTEEIRDSFYENFKELIENCKELL